MTWMAWRQIRLPARVFVGAATLFLVLVAWTGPQLADRFDADGLQQCVLGADDVGDRTCGDLTSSFLADFTLLDSIGGLLTLLPAIVGMFWGAPLLARELETRTNQLAWTQSVTRTRWLAVRLAVVIGVALTVTALVSLAFTWWSEPRDVLDSRLMPGTFEKRGIVPVAYVAFALMLGVAVGAVVRKVIPAAVVTLLVVVVTVFGVSHWVRPKLFEPAEYRFATYSFYGPEPADRLAAEAGWMLSNETVDGEGNVVSTGPLADRRAAVLCDIPLAELEGENNKRLLDACGDRLGLTDVTRAHPASRFWALQVVEFAMFMGFAAALGVFSFRWVRRGSG